MKKYFLIILSLFMLVLTSCVTKEEVTPKIELPEYNGPICLIETEEHELFENIRCEYDLDYNPSNGDNIEIPCADLLSSEAFIAKFPTVNDIMNAYPETKDGFHFTNYKKSIKKAQPRILVTPKFLEAGDYLEESGFEDIYIYSGVAAGIWKYNKEKYGNISEDIIATQKGSINIYKDMIQRAELAASSYNAEGAEEKSFTGAFSGYISNYNKKIELLNKDDFYKYFILKVNLDINNPQQDICKIYNFKK